MRLISHRGNLNGKIPEKENSIEYIKEALSKGFDVEIDLWYVDNKWFLGHDIPQYEVDFHWIDEWSYRLWVHCKNIESVEFLVEYENEYSEINWFWHQEDTLTLTSFGYVWAYPGKQPIKKSIAVLPELYSDDLSKCVGICSDFIENYKK